MIKMSQQFLSTWDVLITLVTLAEIIIVSLNGTFETFMDSSLFARVQLPLFIVLCLDIFLSFLKGYQDKGIFKVDARGSVRHYFKGSFRIDLLSLACFSLAYSLDSQALYGVYVVRFTWRFYDQK